MDWTDTGQNITLCKNLLMLTIFSYIVAVNMGVESYGRVGFILLATMLQKRWQIFIPKMTYAVICLRYFEKLSYKYSGL